MDYFSPKRWLVKLSDALSDENLGETVVYIVLILMVFHSYVCPVQNACTKEGLDKHMF